MDFWKSNIASEESKADQLVTAILNENLLSRKRDVKKIRIPISEVLKNILQLALETEKWNDLDITIIQEWRTPSWIALRIDLWSHPLKLCRTPTKEKFLQMSLISQIEMAALMSYNELWFQVDTESNYIIDSSKESIVQILNSVPASFWINPRHFSPEWWAMYTTESIDTKPQYSFNIEWREFYITDTIDAGRQYIIGYTIFDGTFHPRIFYYSMSGGNWHCAPGVESDGRLSKWEIAGLSYEKWTIVSLEFQHILSIIPKRSWVSKTDPWSRIWETSTPLSNRSIRTPTDHNVLEDFLKEGITSDLLLWDDNVFGHIFWERFIDGSTNEHNATLERISSLIASMPLPEEMIHGMRLSKKLGKMHHTELWIEYDIMEFASTWNNTPVKITISSWVDHPELLWVEDISYDISDNMTSWGIRRKQIHGGIATTKPLEYYFQCPKYIKENGVPIGKQYIDIRPYIQWNPLIQKAKILLNQ